MSNFPTIIINGGGLPGPQGPQGQSGSGTGDVISINGLTGVINGVAFTGTANNYTALQTFSAGISAGNIAYKDVQNDFTAIQIFSTGLSAGGSAGITFNSDISVNQLKIGRGGGNVNTNVAVGRFSMQDNTTGSSNVGIGFNTLRYGTTKSNNIAIGSSALTNTQNSFNVGIGSEALNGNISGSKNIAIGHQAGKNPESTSENIFIGNQCGSGVTFSTGNKNILIGSNNNAVSFFSDDSILIGSSIDTTPVTHRGSIALGSASSVGGSTSSIAIGYSSEAEYEERSIYIGNNSGKSSKVPVTFNYFDNIAIGPNSLRAFIDWDTDFQTPIQNINTAIIIGTYATVGFSSGSENEIVIGNGTPFEYFAGTTNYLQLRGAGPNTTTLGNTATTKTIINGTQTSIANIIGDRVIVSNPRTISSRTETGTAGTICWDQNYLYICVSTNAWAKVGLTW